VLSCEVLITNDTAMRGKTMLGALIECAAKARVDATLVSRYSGKSDWLMLYGAGGKDRIRAFESHIRSGRRTIAWDLGYWDRQRMMRVSIDAMHPQEWVWKKTWPAERFENSGIRLRSVANASGPVVFAGMGHKSKTLHGKWDKLALAALRYRFPSRPIVVREKPLRHADAPRIDKVLDGASLVVTHHSNVAIDAIIAGVPFECSDGAAMAYRGDRVAFLRQLAWLQWNHEEALDAWAFLRELTGE
jgi:hypothetical protein